MAFRPYKPRDYGTTKDVVTRLFDAVDGGIKRVAFWLRRSPTQTQAYSDPACPDELTLDQARRIADAAPAAAIVLAEDFAAAAGGVFLPCATTTCRFEGLVAKSAKEWGEFVSAVVDALADGRIDAGERRAVLAELDQVLHALAAARTELTHEGCAAAPAAAADVETRATDSPNDRPRRRR
ncbi:phage regulatory CII family protein [Rhodoplanes roseus]|uniref:phage regulatory CII family protein n=1 Tax=Rhodoplanes roseus TaxID=29409 RepID=UPI00269F23C2